MNILEMQKLADARGDAYAAMVAQNFMENEGFFGAMEFVEFGGSMSYGWNEEKTLPSAQSRSINADYTQDDGETKAMQEGLKAYGGLIGVDRMAAQQLGSDVVSAKQASQIKAIRLKIMNDFFNGSSATDKTQMDGLKSILPTTTAGRVDRGYVVANGGAALSRKKLDEALANTDIDSGAVIFADKQVPYLINQYGESLVTFDKNEFGAPVARYGDLPIITVDRNSLNAKILGFSEAGSTSSLFVANIDVDKVAMLSGTGGLTASPTEQSGSANKYQVDWLISLMVQGDYNLTRLSGFTNTSMIA
jgi:hypothetical protein